MRSSLTLAAALLAAPLPLLADGWSLSGCGATFGTCAAAQVTAGTDGTSVMPAGTANDYWKRVLSVRIALTLVSGQNEKVGTTGDKLLRKTFTNTIAIRNRL